MTEPTVPMRPYEPFPPFATWARAAVAPSTFRRYAAMLQASRETATAADLREAVRVTTRQAAVDTGAIENLYDVDRGFTFTVATQSLAWDAMHTRVGEQAARYIKDALDAYDYVLDLATGANPVTEQAVREIHSIACRSQATYQVITSAGPQERQLKKGEYKSDPNSPFNLTAGEVHAYASPTDTPPEMSRLIDELNGDEFVAADPTLQASYAHYAFVCVHPFADGNGRVARALASVNLYRDPGVPLVVFADEKNAYLDALEAADRGDHTAFIQFIADRAVDTMAMVTTTLEQGVTDDVAAATSALRLALVGRGGLPHEQVDVIASRLREAFTSALQTGVVRDSVPSDVDIDVNMTEGRGTIPDGYRTEPGGGVIVVDARTRGIGAAHRRAPFSIVIAKGSLDVDDFLVVDSSGSAVVRALLRDVYPIVTSALRYRLDVAAAGQLRSLSEHVMQLTRANLEQAGYV